MDPITVARRRLTFAMIYVGVMKGMDIPLSIKINSRLEKWVQLLEYESVHFACFYYKKIPPIGCQRESEER